MFVYSGKKEDKYGSVVLSRHFALQNTCAFRSNANCKASYWGFYTRSRL